MSRAMDAMKCRGRLTDRKLITNCQIFFQARQSREDMSSKFATFKMKYGGGGGQAMNFLFVDFICFMC